MKKLALLFTLLFSAITFAQGDYTLNGTIKNFKNGKFEIFEISPIDEGASLAKGAIKNGEFTINSKLKNGPEAVTLMIDDEYSAPIFLESGTITIALDTKKIISSDDFGTILDPTLSGTPNLDLLTDFNLRKKAIINAPKYKKLSDAIAKMDQLELDEAPKEAFLPLDKVYDDLFPKRQADVNALKKDIITKNPKSIAALYLIASEDLGIVQSDIEESDLEEVYAIIDPSLKDHKYFKELEQYVLAVRNTKIGAQAPAFTMENDKGGNISLSEYKGKYVLVDFWAHWCVPCVETFPHLKKLYKKYNGDGFEIINISQDPERKPWFAALKKYKNPWAQLIEKEGTSMGDQISDLYNVAFLPTTFLLDKEGKIIATNLEEKDLDAKLKEIFGH